jgi:hypothetical protein
MPQVNIPGVGEVSFPDTMSPDQISAAAKELYDGAALNSSMQTRGFTQPPPQEEFLSKFRNLPKLLDAAAATPVGTAMLGGLSGGGLAKGVPGAGPIASTAGRVGLGAIGGALSRTPILGPMAKGALAGAKRAWASGPLTKAAPIAAEAPTAAPSFLKNLVLTPEQAAQAAQLEALAKQEASRQGMRSAAWGRIGHP